MTKSKTKNNWWIIIVAFIIGLLIGTFALANLFGAGVSLGPTATNCANAGEKCMDSDKICCAGLECDRTTTLCKKIGSTKPVSTFRQVIGRLKNMR